MIVSKGQDTILKDQKKALKTKWEIIPKHYKKMIREFGSIHNCLDSEPYKYFVRIL